MITLIIDLVSFIAFITVGWSNTGKVGADEGGGDEYWEKHNKPINLASVSQDLPEFMKEAGCQTCKAVSWFSYEILGSQVMEDLEYAHGRLWCFLNVGWVAGYDRESCKGIVED